MIKELTLTSWSTLRYYHIQEKNKILSRKEAQDMAKSHIRSIRYGPSMKDYFWITDKNVFCVMHPYRRDIEGKDLSEFRDARGKKLFVEFTRINKLYGEGFVNYMWQWKDNPRDIVQKLSYVKGFKPWGWIIGTGIYINDVNQEIELLIKKITRITIAILIVILLLLIFVIHQGTVSQSESIHDPLTGLYNRRYMDEVFKTDIKRAMRHNIPLSIIMADIDNFKKFNDSYGHKTGDLLLSELGILLRNNTRGNDSVFRYGGEEFILLMSMSLNDVVIYSNKLREKVKKLKIVCNNRTIDGISISIGVAGYPEHGLDPRIILEKADNALYMAKEAGRDCVKVASSFSKHDTG